LYFGSICIENFLGLTYKLLSDGVFFKRVKNLFRPRSIEHIEELKKAEVRKNQKKQLEEEFLQQCLSKKHDPSFKLDPKIEPYLTTLKSLAANSKHIDNAKQKDLKTLTPLLCEKLDIEIRGDRNDQAYKILKAINEISSQTNPSIFRYNPKLNFSEKAFKEIDYIKNSIKAICDNNTQRLDLRHLDSITIDDISTLDMDDAFSLEKKNNGYQLGIHISDVASAVKNNSELDLEARERATSVYLPEQTINMLPEEISNDLCSLVVGKDRLSISCICQLDSMLNFISAEIKPSIIRVTQKYTYDEVDKLLEHDEGMLLQLYNIALSNEATRFANGGTRIPKQIAQFSVSESGQITKKDIDENSPARALVGELMILANTVFANFAIENNLPAFFRSQEAPNDDTLINPDIPEGPAYSYAIKSRLKKSTTSFSPAPHHTLGVDAYLQATSPIRRYLDLILQRQFLHFLETQEVLFSESELTEIITLIENSVRIANSLTRESIKFWSLKWLKQNKRVGTTIKATVLRNDLKNPMIELDELYAPWIFKTNKKLKPGQVVDLKIHLCDPWKEYLKLELHNS
ncbi:MAG: RNB domain-containing ribonuclease, partial [Bdellovibrionales bacterium]|nr:RNB domain-containing ribonuclease [Bdellovibrionales bacterium]